MTNQNSPKKKKQISTYLKFSNIAIQMGVLITLGAYSGNWLDEKQNNQKPIWTLILVLLTIFASLFHVIREVIKMSKEDDVKGD